MNLLFDPKSQDDAIDRDTKNMLTMHERSTKHATLKLSSTNTMKDVISIRRRPSALVTLLCLVGLQMIVSIAHYLYSDFFNNGRTNSGGDILNSLQDEEELEDISFQAQLMGTFDEEMEVAGFDMPSSFLEELERHNGGNDAEMDELVKSMESSSADALYDNIQPYTLSDALLAADIYDRAFGVLVYDPLDDEFVLLYSRRHYWTSRCTKLLHTFRSLTHMLRTTFPGRFLKGHSPELVIPISAGDYPGVKVRDAQMNCVREVLESQQYHTPCAESQAPILHFGSVFRRPMFPSIVAMPMPEYHHLNCFEQWAKSQTVCAAVRSVNSEGFIDTGELVFENDVGLNWDELIPQVVWRGTDFDYLRTIYPTLYRPEYAVVEDNIKPDLTTFKKKKAAASSLRKVFASLPPRWQGVVFTAEAEIESHRAKTLPWANIKFSGYIENGEKKPAIGSEKYEKWQGIDFNAAGAGMSLEELAKYKYQIDLGGGGGTTWSGTIQKLAMPGLLFHHVTPTKDYIHDRMTPWIHYVPVASDLSDLKEKFDWAESHPHASQWIARRGSQFVQELGTREGYEQLFGENFVEPLRKVIEAYQPVSQKTLWRAVLEGIEGDAVLPVLSCNGLGSSSNFCSGLDLQNISHTITNALRRERVYKTVIFDV